MYNLANVGSWSAWAPMGVGLGVLGVLLVTVIVAALIALKGFALWTAAKRDEKWWFIALLVFNTLGILELIYLIFIAKRWGGHRDNSQPSQETNPESKI